MINSSAAYKNSTLNNTNPPLTVQYRTMAWLVTSCHLMLSHIIPTHYTVSTQLDYTTLCQMSYTPFQATPYHIISYHWIPHYSTSCHVIHVKHSSRVKLTNIHQSHHWVCKFRFCSLCMNCSSLFVSPPTPVRTYVISKLWPNSFFFF